MDSGEPCKICGCTETHLVDGFYYCTECGTQDTNVRETLLEFVDTAGARDGALLIGVKKKITLLPQPTEVQMSEDWYKWHTLNYLLSGLADEIIAAGAKPSFKTKLLWIWTRYMDKYQNKADFGLTVNEGRHYVDKNKKHTEKSHSDDDNDSDDDDSNDEDDNNDNNYNEDVDYESLKKRPPRHNADRRDIKNIGMTLVISMLYVALNLDKSHIQLSHLIRLMKQGKVSVISWVKLVPNELKPKKLSQCLFYDIKCFSVSYFYVRMQSLSIFRELDLGNPIVPDLRVLVDMYLQELCLPSDLKPLVLSLIHIRSFDYLDVNVQKHDIVQMPSYELYVMGHILMALKICFGLDSEYEYKISDMVDKINEQENYLKSYNIFGNSEPTDRLFCFRDWCTYLEYRKNLLSYHTLHLGTPDYLDMNDYVAMEHLGEKPDFNKTLKDEITADIVKKIQCEGGNTIPSSAFIATVTPHTTYARVIFEHMQDPHEKMLLAEDFTQYSLKYITEDMLLVDPDSSHPINLLTGVSTENKSVSDKPFCFRERFFVASNTKVYVKDCDNHNWLITQRPNLEHVSKIENGINEKEIDNNNESEDKSTDSTLYSDIINDPSEKIEHNILTENYENDLENDRTKIEIEIFSEDGKLVNIQEESENVNIFDDDFFNLDVKKEEEEQTNYNDDDDANDNVPGYNSFESHEIPLQGGDDNSDASSQDSILLNADSLDRNEAIKELLVHACRKYKIYAPGVVGTKKSDLTRKIRGTRVKTSAKRGNRRRLGEVKQKVNELMSAYHTHVRNDIINHVSVLVQDAITDFNKTIERAPFEESQLDAEVVNDGIENHTLENNDSVMDDDYKLFGDSSEGETYPDELLPKPNPEFDEKTHDVRQLYLKMEENLNDPEMKLNSKLFEIVDRSIKRKKEIADRSDSEEDIPLNLLVEQKKIQQQLSSQQELAKTLKPLIENNHVRSYNYSLRYYEGTFKAKTPANLNFAEQMNNHFSKSFSFVLQQCADVVGYEPCYLFKSLENIEKFLTTDNILLRNGIKRPRYDSLSISEESKRSRGQEK